jgi:hypothetical protein
MQQNSSSEAKSSLASQEILRILCNPSVHYRIQKSPLHLPFLRQVNLVHGRLWLLKIHFNIIPNFFKNIYFFSLRLRNFQRFSSKHKQLPETQMYKFDVILTVHRR